MAYPGNFLRLQVQGTGYGEELWSWSLSIVPNFEGPGPIEAPATVPQAVIDAVTTFHTAGTYISKAARLATIKLNAIGPDGRYLSQSNTVLHDLEPTVPGSGVRNAPPQVSLAVSLMTGVRRGPAHTGRFYLPYVSEDPAADGLIPAITALNVAQHAVNMINDLNAALDGVVGVASPLGAGQFHQATHVRVGRVLDTVRRRRNAIPETYTTPSAVVLTPP